MIKIYTALVVVVLAMGGILFYSENRGGVVAIVDPVVDVEEEEKVVEPVVIPKPQEFVFVKGSVPITVEVAPGWYIYNDDASPSVIFTKNQDLIIPVGTAGNAVGPNFTVAVTNITDIAGVTTPEEWLAKQGYVDDDPLAEHSMIRVVSEESGGFEGRTLIYVHFYDLQRIIIFTQWPYEPGSEITKVFEEMVSKFVPSPRQIPPPGAL